MINGQERKVHNSNYTIEQYNILYANTLCYLRFGQKKFIYLFKETQGGDSKQAHEYLKIIKEFIKNYDLSIQNSLKRLGFFQNNYYGEDTDKSIKIK